MKSAIRHSTKGGRGVDNNGNGEGGEAGQEEEEEEEGAKFVVATNDGGEDVIVVLAHVKEKIVPVHCGFGTQQVKWLGHVAIARYDEERVQGWRQLGVPAKMVKDGKLELKLTDLICDVLTNHSHVYITTSLG